MAPSLNTLQPENVAHGSEILLQAQGPTAGYITIAEIFNVTYDADQKLEQVPIFGTSFPGTIYSLSNDCY